jgi:iron complex outermembrane receptor protein
MYGPFSAAYPGNSVGAVVDYVTRMPARFEAHAKVGHVVQPFDLYGTRRTYRAWQASASIGDRAGDWSWWINLHHTDSQGQPLTFATRLAGNGTAGSAGTPVTGAVAGLNSANQPWFILGAGTRYDTRQDHLKIKLAYDLTSSVRASYVLGLWRNLAEGNSESYLRDGSGNAVYSGPINIGGRDHAALSGADFALTRERLLHVMHGLSVKRHTRGEWDWEIAASLYDYQRDDKRQNSAANVQPGAWSGGPGTLADGSGTGWNNLALKGIWRPAGLGGAHIVDFGVQLDRYRLRYRTSNIAGNYLSDAPGTLASAVRGDTQLHSLRAGRLAAVGALEDGARAARRALARLRRPHRLLGDQLAVP